MDMDIKILIRAYWCSSLVSLSSFLFSLSYFWLKDFEL